eukprot:361448-Chlamydomonas_euryale.AAC.3
MLLALCHYMVAQVWRACVPELGATAAIGPPLSGATPIVCALVRNRCGSGSCRTCGATYSAACTAVFL